MRETAREQAERLGIKWPGEKEPHKRKPVVTSPRTTKRVPSVRLPREVEPGEPTFRTTQVVREVGVSYRQLDYWDRIDFIKPSIRRASGSGDGKERLYSLEDVRLLKKTKRLLDLGFRLSAIQRHGPGGLEELVRFHIGMVQVGA